MNKSKLLTVRTPHWFDFIEEGDTAEIRIDGVIGESFFEEDGTSARDFIARLNSLSAPNLIVHINSPGGSVFDGFAIYNALTASDKHVRVIVDGIAASIAAVIAMAGDEIVMPESSYLMIHYPCSICIGNSEKMIAEAATLDDLGKSIEKVFTDRSGAPLEKIQELMKGQPGADGTFISADKALELKLCTEVEPNQIAAAACAGLECLDFIPSALNKRTADQTQPEANPDSFRNVFAEFHSNN